MWLNISFNKAVTTFESGFTEHLGAVIIKNDLVGFLCKLGFKYILRNFLSISVTSKLNLIFINYLFSDKTLTTGLVTFVYFNFMLLFRPSMLLF